MKILDKISLVLFSIIILVLSMVICFLVFGWVDVNTVSTFLKQGLNSSTVSNTMLAISIVFILLALKSIFFHSNSKTEEMAGEGVLLENESGRLLISKDTIENLVNTVVKGFETIENVTTKVRLDKENNLSVYVTLLVQPDTIIKDVSVNMQTRIKEVIKQSSGLEIKEVNIKVKNISTKSEQ